MVILWYYINTSINNKLVSVKCFILFDIVITIKNNNVKNEGYYWKFVVKILF